MNKAYSYHRDDIKRFILERKKEHEEISKHNIPEYIPYVEMKLSDRLIYEKNINNSLAIIIQMEKNGDLEGLERNLKYKLFLTQEEKILKEKIKYYRRNQGDEKSIRNLDRVWSLKPKALKLTMLGLVKYLSENPKKIDNTIKDKIQNEKDNEFIINNQRDFVLLIRNIMYAIHMQNRLNSSIRKELNNSSIEIKENDNLNKMLNMVLTAINQNPQAIKKGLNQSKNQELNNIISRNSKVIHDYIVSNPRKMKKIVNYAILEAEKDIENKISNSKKKKLKYK